MEDFRFEVKEQCQYFYTDVWSKEVDDVFVRGITQEAIVGNFGWNPDKDESLVTVQERMKSIFPSIKFHMNVLEHKLAMLYNRHRTCQSLRNYGEVHWDEAEKRFIASESKRQRLFMSRMEFHGITIQESHGKRSWH